MRDEGGLSQAMELARDVMFAATECLQNPDVATHATTDSNSEMLTLWCDLLRHMDQVSLECTAYLSLHKFKFNSIYYSVVKVNHYCTLSWSSANRISFG